MKEGELRVSQRELRRVIFSLGYKHVTHKGSDKKRSERLVGFFCRVIGSWSLIGSLKHILGCPICPVAALNRFPSRFCFLGTAFSSYRVDGLLMLLIDDRAT